MSLLVRSTCLRSDAANQFSNVRLEAGLRFIFDFPQPFHGGLPSAVPPFGGTWAQELRVAQAIPQLVFIGPPDENRVTLDPRHESLGRSFRNQSSNHMAFPHPQSRKDHYRSEDIPSSGRVVWNLVKRTIDVADDRNGKDDMNPAKNPTFGDLAHRSPRFTILCRLRWPVGCFNTELLGIFGVQSLPAGELHRITTGDAANGSSAEKVIQDIESNVPPGSTHGDEAAIDLGPERQARAAPKRFEFPPVIAVLEHLESVGSRHFCFHRSGRTHPREVHGSDGTQASIDIKGRPLAQMRRIGERLPHLFRRVTQLSAKNERPLVSILSYLRLARGTRCVLLGIGHLLLLVLALFFAAGD